MPKIKIVWVQQYSDEWDTKIVMRGVPEEDFEEISAEDLQLLRHNLHRIPRPGYELEPKIVMLDEVPISTRLETVKEAIAKLEADRLAQIEKHRRSREKAKRTKEEREREKFLAMKKKFEPEAS